MIGRRPAKLGQIDMLIYSVAAPRRVDPVTGQTYQSAVKPIGSGYRARNVTYADGQPRACVRRSSSQPARPRSRHGKVMGGEDWAAWVTDLVGRGLPRLASAPWR